MLDDVPPEAFDRYARLTEDARRGLARLAKLYGRSGAFLRHATALLARAQPGLSARLHAAQLYAWGHAATAVLADAPQAGPHALAAPAHRPPAPPGRPPIVDPRDPHPAFVFPAIAAARHHVQTRIPYTHAEYDRLDGEARHVAFTVARVQTESAARAVRDAVHADVERGGTLPEFRAAVEDALAGSGLSGPQVEAIYRTHVGRAYAAGQAAVLHSPAVRSAVPYLLYSAVHDSRTRPEHRALEAMGLDGTGVYRADDPVWDSYYPPWAWNCRCHAVPLGVADAAGYGVREAQEWLRTGSPPRVPQFARPPGFALPRGWTPTGRRLAHVEAA